MNEKKPVYEAKVNKILQMMKFQTREEVARELKYKSWKSLDTYMRRKNFLYDAIEGQYIPRETDRYRLERDPKNYAPSKIVSIITAFESEEADPKLIAKKEGFKDHKEMADYMKLKGYEWNVYKNNYLKMVGKIEDESEINEIPNKINMENDKNRTEGMDEYVPFVRFLYEKRDDIYQLLSGVKEDGKIPRYAVPGLVRTKAIYMSDMVAKLAAEFSREKNLTQREIMEAALIEYLQKYGFKSEIDMLLKNP